MVALPIRMRPAIVLFGDSITQQGFGWDGGTGWVSLLSSAYSRRADVLNRGYSGYNTRHGVDLLSRVFGPQQFPIPESIDRNSKRMNDDGNNQKDVLFVTIFFGANDAALQGELQHVPLDEYGDNLSKMISYIRGNSLPAERSNEVDHSGETDCAAASGTEGMDGSDGISCTDDHSEISSKSNNDEIPIILLTPPPVDIDAWYKERGEPKNENRNDRANNNAREYGQRAKDVASNYSQCSVVDVFDLLGGNGPVEDYAQHLRDGLHLSSSGNKLVYEGLMDTLQSKYPHLLPMMDGNGRYGTTGMPLEEKLWRELC